MSFLLHPLFLVTFFPVLGLLVIAFLKEEQRSTIRWTALVTALIDFGLSLGCWPASMAPTRPCSSTWTWCG